MALFEGKTPAERNKLIAAIALGLVALLFLARMLFSGPSSSLPPRAGTATRGGAQPTRANGAQPNPRATPTPDSENPLVAPQPVDYPLAVAAAPEPGRNIFAYYEAPRPAATEPLPPEPSPTPPPLTITRLSPANVFARTGNFMLEVTGEQFTPETRVVIDNATLETRFVSPQQLVANVPAQLIADPGARQVSARTPDGQLYSNTTTFNVTPAPVPPFTYVGLVTQGRNDTAVLRDQRGELTTVRPGDPVGGRFRVSNILENAIELTDTQLNITHTLPYVEVRPGTNNPGPAPRVPTVIQRPPQPPPRPSPTQANSDPQTDTNVVDDP